MRFWANSGFSISFTLSYPTLANQSLNGSAFGDGIDWMILNAPSVLTQFVSLFLPSGARSSRGVQIVPQLAFRTESRLRIFLTYCLGSALSVRIETISNTENHHSLLCQVLLIFFP